MSLKFFAELVASCVSDLIVLHTGEELGDQIRQFEYPKEQFDKAWRDHVHHVRIDLYDKHHPGHEGAEAALIEVLLYRAR